MRRELSNLNKQGQINDYLYYHLFNRVDIHDQNTASELIREAQELTKLGVECEDDHKHFTYIRMHLKKIATDIAGQLDSLTLAKLASYVYNNRNSYPIDTILNFYKAVEHGLSELDVPFNKFAYPLSIETYDAKEERDIDKWLQGVREIYELVHRGYTFDQAFNMITEHWDIMEKNQYKYWLNFYQSGEHMKYKMAEEEKTAQLGYQIPYDAIKVRVPDMNEIKFDPYSSSHYEKAQPSSQEAPPTLRSSELPMPTTEQISQANVERKIQSIIGRLSAAEKLATRPEVIKRLNQVLDIDVSEWLKRLYELKLSIQRTPIRNVASTILEDLIIKEANILIKNGKVNAGRLLKSIAQEPMENTTVSDPSQSPMRPPSLPTPIGTPGDVGPAPLPEQGPAPTETSPTASMPDLPSLPEEPKKSDGDMAMEEFISNLNMEYPDEDKGKADDCEDSITVMAQEVMPGRPMLTTEEAAPARPVERPAPHIKVEEEPDMDSFDLDNVKISDVVKRLELVSNVIKNREIPRQLAVVDLMLDKLGIAAFFPTLAEATRSALESNQYMSTRVEDILGKLRGSLEPSEKEKIDLAPEKTKSLDNTLEAVKQNLRDEDKRQKDLKEKRQALREQEAAVPEAAAKKETPKELTQPVRMERMPPRMPR